MTNLTNIEISNLSSIDWIKIKKTLLNTYPNYNFQTRFEMMLNIKNILDDEKIKIFLANGTLLGAVREKNFIEWDNDVDMDVFYEEFAPKFEIIRDRLLKLNYVVRTVSTFPEMKINCYFNGEKVGILALYLNNSERFRCSYKWPKYLYEESETILFKNTTFLSPKIKDYLEHQYGKNWTVPLKKNYFNKELFRK